jgi:hypothetical protein
VASTLMSDPKLCVSSLESLAASVTAAFILLPTTVPTGVTDLPTGPTLAEETEPSLVRPFKFSVAPFASHFASFALLSSYVALRLAAHL